MPHTIKMQSPRLAARLLLLALAAAIGVVGVLTWAQYRSAVDHVQRETEQRAHADYPDVPTWSYDRAAERAHASRFEDALGLDATAQSSADTSRRLQADRVRAAMLRLAVSGSGYLPPGVSTSIMIRAANRTGAHGVAADSPYPPAYLPAAAMLPAAKAAYDVAPPAAGRQHPLQPASRQASSASLTPISTPQDARQHTRRIKVLFAAATMAIVAALAALLLSVSRRLVGHRLNAAMTLAEQLALGDLGARAAAPRYSLPA